MHLYTAEEGMFTRLSTTFRHELHAGGSLLLPSRHVTKRTFDRNRNQTYSPSAALHLKIWLLAFRETDSEVSDIRCHFMTRVMGSHFLTRDQGDLRLHSLEYREGCALSVAVRCWPSSCNSNVREREGAELLFEPCDQPGTPGSASTRRRNA